MLQPGPRVHFHVYNSTENLELFCWRFMNLENQNHFDVIMLEIELIVSLIADGHSILWCRSKCFSAK